MGTSIAKTGGDPGSEIRRAQLRSYGQQPINTLKASPRRTYRQFPGMSTSSCVRLLHRGLDTPLEGKAAVAAWFAGLYPVLGEVRVIEHYINEEMTAICTEALVW